MSVPAAKDEKAAPAPIAVEAVVVGVPAQPVAVQGVAANPAGIGLEGEQTGKALFPVHYGMDKQWRQRGLCGDCGTADCVMAWCCTCFPIAQLFEKFRVAEKPVAGVKYEVWIGIFFVAGIVDYITTGQAKGTIFSVIQFVCLFMLTKAVRKQYNIPGSDFNDCICSFFCGPCQTQKLVTQMWTDPSTTPGCSCSGSVAHIV